MRVKFKHGGTVEGSVRQMQGFVADEITIDDADAKVLYRMLHGNPREFAVWVEQFLARFPSNRV